MYIKKKKKHQLPFTLVNYTKPCLIFCVHSYHINSENKFLVARIGIFKCDLQYDISKGYQKKVRRISNDKP